MLFAISGRGVSHLPNFGNLGECTLIVTRLAIWCAVIAVISRNWIGTEVLGAGGKGS